MTVAKTGYAFPAAKPNANTTGAIERRSNQSGSWMLTHTPLASIDIREQACSLNDQRHWTDSLGGVLWDADWALAARRDEEQTT